MDEVTGQPPAGFREYRVEADGSQITYREAGQGNLVIILDGLSWGTWRLHEALAQKCHVIAMELPGFGTSTENTVSRSAQDLAGTITHALEKIAPEHYTLIGRSFSANVALWQTLLTPDRVEALILISPTCLHPAEVWESGVPNEVFGRMLAHPERFPAFSDSESSFFEREISLVRQLGGGTHDADAEARLDEIECPTLVVFGSRDNLVSPRAPSIYREKIPNSNLSIVYDAGHAIVTERPEALLNVVADYVDRRETFVVSRQSGLVSP